MCYVLKMSGLWSINEPTATSLPPCVPECLHATSPAQQDRSDYLTVRYSVFSGTMFEDQSEERDVCVSIMLLCALWSTEKKRGEVLVWIV